MSEPPTFYNVLLGCTGSVASIKVPDLVQAFTLVNAKVNVKVVATIHSLHFFNRIELPVEVLSDDYEQKQQDTEIHEDLTSWADIFVIAPLDANTLGKAATGIADNLLTRVIRGWDTSRPLLFAPAMNTCMWNHPITAQQTATLRQFGYEEIECIEKTLVCGDTGKGAMAAVETIVEETLKHLDKLSTKRLQHDNK